MSTSNGEILGGFVIRPVRLREGEEIIRMHDAYRKFAFGLVDFPGALILTSTRLVWRGLWLVKTIRKDDTIDVSLRRKWGMGLFGHWSLRVKSDGRTEFFRLKPRMSSMPWNRKREKEAAQRWVGLVKHWAS
jgi:hypothetical protein